MFVCMHGYISLYECKISKCLSVCECIYVCLAVCIMYVYTHVYVYLLSVLSSALELTHQATVLEEKKQNDKKIDQVRQVHELPTFRFDLCSLGRV